MNVGTRRVGRRPIALLLTAVALLAPAAAQDDASEEAPPRPAALEVAEITSRIAALEAATDLADATKQAAIASYRQALEQLARARELLARKAEVEAQIAEAPSRLARLRERLSSAPPDVVLEVPTGATLGELEQRLARAEAELASARAETEQLRREAGLRGEQRATFGEQLVKLERRAVELSEQLRASPAPDTPLQVTEARRALLEAQLVEVAAEQASLDAALRGHEAGRELLIAQTDLALRRVALAEKAHAAWQQAVADRRKQEAEHAKREAEEAARQAEERLRREAIRQTPRLLELIETNKQLAAVRAGPTGLTAQLAEANERLTEAREELVKLRESFRNARRKAEAAGVSNAMGQLLRKHLERLAELGALARRGEERQERIAEIQYQLILREEERLEAAGIEREVRESLADLPPEQRARVEAVAREVLTARRDLLDAAIRDTDLLFNRLLELEQVTQQLVAGAAEYRRYIEERILWVRSVAGSPTPDLRAARAAVGALLFDPEWPDALRASARGALARWPELILWALALALAIAARPWFERRMRGVVETLWHPAEDRFVRTLEALFATLALATALPLLTLAAAWALRTPTEPTRVASAVAGGLEAAALAMVAFEVLRHVIRPQGLAAAHFRWRSSSLAALRRHLRWFAPVTLVCMFVVATLDDLGAPTHNDSLGRLAFVAEVVALSVFAQRVLRPTGPVFANYLLRHAGSWLDRLRWVWYPLATGLPVALGVLALRGYYFSAQQLLARVQWSLSLVIGLILLNALLLRWLRLARSRLIHFQAEEAAAREREAAAAREREAAAALEREAPAAEAAEPSAPDPLLAADAPVEAPGAPAAAPDPLTLAPPPASLFDSGMLEVPALPPPPRAVTRRVRRPDLLAVDAGAESSLVLEEEEVDHAAISSRTRKLFRSALAVVAVFGLFAIWADVLPALQRLEQVQIYPAVQLIPAAPSGEPRRSVLEEVEPEAGAPKSAQGEGAAAGASGAQQPVQPMGRFSAAAATATAASGAARGQGGALPDVVTLADLGVALLILGFTLIAAQNGPAMLEVLLLERVALDSGTRYAIATVARYLIVLVGVIVGFGAVGFRWTSIQWLAAALTLGLAFGLQEIFANFVSGLIILFERPIRLGDWVTVGEATGVVSRIRMRATTITDLDRKELIVPNKAFVTGDVLNWALSDSVLRLNLAVSVAAATDAGQARGALLDVARAHPKVLSEPQPEAFFLSLGPGSLEFELHAYIDHPIHRNVVRHELNEAIVRTFRERGLELAHPSHDLHLRSAGPELLAALRPPPSAPGAAARPEGPAKQPGG